MPAAGEAVVMYKFTVHINGLNSNWITRGLPTHGLDNSQTECLADWLTSGLDKSRARQLMDAAGSSTCNFSVTRNSRHRQAAAKPAACAKPLMLSTLGREGYT